MLEALLALAIGGIVLTQSMGGFSRYSEGLRVQASASLLKHLTAAADRYAQDNYAALAASAPQELSVDVLQPYFSGNGGSIGLDAFHSDFVLRTRVYDITVPNPAGGTMTEQGLQILVLARKSDNSAFDEKPSLIADVANSVGPGAGFISQGNLKCSDGAGGVAAAGTVCGAFGAYAIPSTDFGLTAADFEDYAYSSLITTGDGSVYGDQLYRYDYGVAELNTMHTDIAMDGDPTTARKISSVNGNLTFETNQGTGLTLNEASGSIELLPRNAIVEFGARSGSHGSADIYARDAFLRNIDADTNATVGSDLSVGQDATIDRNATIRNDLFVQRDADVTRDIDAGRNVSAGNDLTSGRHVTAGEDIRAGRDGSIARNLIVGNNGTIGGRLTVGSLKSTSFGNNTLCTGNSDNLSCTGIDTALKITVVKTEGAKGDVHAKANCPSGTVRVACSGARNPSLVDTPNEGEVGYIGTRPVGTRSCEVAADTHDDVYGNKYRPTVWAYCLAVK